MKRLIFFLFLSNATLFVVAQGVEHKAVATIKQYLANTPYFYSTLSINQPRYEPGDTVKFAAHVRDMEGLPLRGYLVMDLLAYNHTGKLIARSIFKVKDGVGHSEMLLPDSLTAGYYRLMLRNEWHKNFNPEALPTYSIEVVNGKKLTHQGPSVDFFPEGGTLVGGTRNNIVLRTTGSNKNFSIRDDRGVEVAHVITNEQGLGQFEFSPGFGISYFAYPDSSGRNRYALPEVQKDGVAIRLVSDGQQPVKVFVGLPATSDIRKNDAELLIISNQSISYRTTLSLKETTELSIELPRERVPEDLCQILILQKGEVLAERYFTLGSGRRGNANLRVEPLIARQRETVRIDLNLSDAARTPRKGVTTVRVLNDNYFNGADLPQNINLDRVLADGLTKSNDLGLITCPSVYDWRLVLKEDKTRPSHAMRTLLYKKGRAYFSASGEPLPDSTLLTVFLQKHFMGYETHTAENGMFDLSFLFDFFGTDELFYVAEHKGRLLKDVSVEWLEELPEPKAEVASKEVEQPDPYGQFRDKCRLVDASYRFFSDNAQNVTATALVNPNAEFEDEFMGADVTVNVDDYVVFPTMEELIREVIPSLQHRKIRGTPSVRVVFSVSSIIPQGDPVYIIDGVMTKNTEFFLSLKPADLLVVKVEKDVNKLTRLGTIGKNGIVYVQTRKQNIAAKLAKETTVIPVLGLGRVKEVSALEKDNVMDWRKPDFRSTVFWSPQLQTDPDGESTIMFKLGDDVGPITIRVEGFTENGHRFYDEKTIQVNFEKQAGN